MINDCLKTMTSDYMVAVVRVDIKDDVVGNAIITCKIVDELKLNHPKIKYNLKREDNHYFIETA